MNTMKTLTAEQKMLALQTVRERIESGERLRPADLPIFFRSRLDLEWKDYTTDVVPGGFKRWLAVHFPEIQLTEDASPSVQMAGCTGGNAPGPMHQLLTPEIKQRVYAILSAQCDASGMMLLSRVAEHLLANGITWRRFLPEGETMTLLAWLSRHFNNIEVVERGLVRYIRIVAKPDDLPVWLSEMETLRKSLLVVCEDAVRRVADGRRVPSALHDLLADYDASWARLLRRAESLKGCGLDAFNDCTLKDIGRILSPDSSRTMLLKETALAFDKLIGQTAAFFKTYHLIAADEQPFVRERALVNGALLSTRHLGILHETLARYRQLCAIMATEQLTDAQAEALYALCSHFGIGYRVAMRVLVNCAELPIEAAVADIAEKLEALEAFAANRPETEALKAVTGVQAALKTPETPSEAQEASLEAPEAGTRASKTETPKAEAETPKAEAETPKAETETPRAEARTPEAEAKTPEAEAETPKAETETPRAEAETPEAEAKTPEAEAKTPKAEAKTPGAETKTSETETPETEAPETAVANNAETQEQLDNQAAYDLYQSHWQNGRKQHAAMAIRYLLCAADATWRDRAKTEAETRFADMPLTLTAIFQRVLTETEATEIASFCRECACFINQDEPSTLAADPILADIAPWLTDSDCAFAENEARVKALLTNPADPAGWREAIHLPYRETPEAYAKLLFAASMFNTSLWGTCVYFCRTNQLYSLMCVALTNRLLNAPVNGNIVACQKDLKDSAAFLHSLRGLPATGPLVEALCATYAFAVNRYESLRAVKTIAIHLGCEDILLERLSDELTGSHANLGSVMVGELLLAGRVSTALPLARRLDACDESFRFKPLIHSLVGLTESDLAALIERPDMRGVLLLMQPDGNRPSYDDVRTFTMQQLAEAQAANAAYTMSRLLAIFPDDPSLYINLYFLCKEAFEGRVPLLFRALQGLCSYYQDDKVRSIRDEQTMLRLTALAACVNASLDETVDFDPRVHYTAHMGDRAEEQEADAYVDFYQTHRQALADAADDTERDLIRERMLACASGQYAEALAQGQPASLLPYVAISDAGLARGILRYYLSHPTAHETFNQRLHSLSGEAYASFRTHWVTANTLFQECASIPAADLQLLLRYPIEEKSVFYTVYEDIMATTDVDPFLKLVLLGALSYSEYSADLIQIKAREAFENRRVRDDARAFVLYRALTRLNRRYHVYSRLFVREGATITESIRRMQYEHNEARMRVSGVFSGDAETMANVSSPRFNPWSCANMVLFLVTCWRANEIMRLRQAFCPANQALVDMLFDSLNPNIPDEEKLKRAEQFTDPMVRGMLYYYLRNVNFGLFFLQEEQNRQYANTVFRRIAATEGWSGGLYPHYLYTPNRLNLLLWEQSPVTPLPTPQPLSPPLSEPLSDRTPDQPAEISCEEPAPLPAEPTTPTCVVFNQEGPPFGHLQGWVYNHSPETVTALTVRAQFDDGDMSRAYALPALNSDTAAPFMIEYAAPFGAERLHYTIKLTYTHDETVCTAEPYDGELTIVTPTTPKLPQDFYAQLAEQAEQAAQSEPLTQADFNALITAPCETSDLRFTDEALAMLFQRTGGSPAHAAHLCRLLVERLTERSSGVVYPYDLSIVARQASGQAAQETETVFTLAKSQMPIEP